jgi:dipeptidase
MIKKAVSCTALCAVLIAFAAFPALRGRVEPSISASEAERPEGCTVIMVGKNASADGSVMTTHAADCGVCDVTWRHVPAADHKPGETRNILHINQIRTWPPSVGLKWDMVLKDVTGVSIPQARHTYGYHHAVFGYLNDQQLAIAESTIGNRKKMSNPTPSGIMDITMLTLVAMERCHTAREAIKLMGGLAERYGYGFHDGGEMLAVADPEEVWEFEIMPVGPLWTPKSGKPGAIWCAQRVPDDEVSVCPNESRIGEIDLADTDHFMASANVVSYAVENGYYDPASGKPFNWKKAYDPVDGSAESSEGRIQRLWRFFDLVAPSKKLAPETPNMDLPFSVKPDKKLSVADVMELTRDKSAGTRYDPLTGVRGGPFRNPNYHRAARMISVPNVEYTTLTQCRSWLPAPVGGIVWVALGSQDTSCYMPFYAGVAALPGSFSVGDHWELNRDSARWAFDYVDFHVQVAYAPAIDVVKAARAKWEMPAVARTPEVDRIAADLYKRSPSHALDYLTGYCLTNARDVIGAWWRLGDDLLVRFNHFGDYDAGKRTAGRLQPSDVNRWPRAVKAMDALAEQP